MMGDRKVAVSAVGHLRRQATLLLLAVFAALMLSSGVALAATITCQSDVVCLGTKKADALKGTDGSDEMRGRAGNDTLRGFDGNDDIYAQRGNDKLFGGSGLDRLIGGPGRDALSGGSSGGFHDNYYFGRGWGKDTITDSDPRRGWVHFYNGPNSEAYVKEDLTIKLLSGTGPEVKDASGTNTINWEGSVIRGVDSGDGDDTITGNNFTNSIGGGRGMDTIFGLGGDDYIYVADGEADTVYCGSNVIGSPDEDHVLYDAFDAISDDCEEKTPTTL